MLVQNSPQIQGAVNTLLEINHDAQARREFEYREKQRRDAVSREKRARREEKHEIARNFLQMGMSVDQVAKGTGLTVAEVEKLKM